MSAPVTPGEQSFLNEEASHWGKWKAKSVIILDNVIAFLPGHDVPNDHVTKFHLEDLVEPIGAHEAADAPVEEKPAPAGQTIEGKPAK